MAKRKLQMRTAERVIRNAFDLEDLARRLRADGHERFADAIGGLSRKLGDVGRSMEDAVEEQR